MTENKGFIVRRWDEGSAPRDSGKVRAGMTWCSECQSWVDSKTFGVRFKAPEGWQKLFGAPEKPRGLTVVSLAYTDAMWVELQKEIHLWCQNNA